MVDTATIRCSRGRHRLIEHTREILALAENGAGATYIASAIGHTTSVIHIQRILDAQQSTEDFISGVIAKLQQSEPIDTTISASKMVALLQAVQQNMSRRKIAWGSGR